MTSACRRQKQLAILVWSLASIWLITLFSQMTLTEAQGQVIHTIKLPPIPSYPETFTFEGGPPKVNLETVKQQGLSFLSHLKPPDPNQVRIFIETVLSHLRNFKPPSVEQIQMFLKNNAGVLVPFIEKSSLDRKIKDIVIGIIQGKSPGEVGLRKLNWVEKDDQTMEQCNSPKPMEFRDVVRLICDYCKMFLPIKLANSIFAHFPLIGELYHDTTYDVEQLLLNTDSCTTACQRFEREVIPTFPIVTSALCTPICGTMVFVSNMVFKNLVCAVLRLFPRLRDLGPIGVMIFGLVKQFIHSLYKLPNFCAFHFLPVFIGMFFRFFGLAPKSKVHHPGYYSPLLDT